MSDQADVKVGSGAATGAPKKKRDKRAPRVAGERRYIALVKGPERVSFSLGPAPKGSKTLVRTRKRLENKKFRTIIEEFEGEDFAKSRYDELVSAATTKGWSESKEKASAEDLL